MSQVNTESMCKLLPQFKTGDLIQIIIVITTRPKLRFCQVNQTTSCEDVIPSFLNL